MGKTCNTILGLGLAGAIIGMHVYMFMEPKQQCDIKDDFHDSIEDLKEVTRKLKHAVK